MSGAGKHLGLEVLGGGPAAAVEVEPTGEISTPFAEIYGASVSKETISRITDKVIEEMTDWSRRPLDAIYAAVFIDAIVVKVAIASASA
ncbi:hypothetical protein KRMM14A1004_39480 [Krasilnikovia sp. MM14-A1004]